MKGRMAAATWLLLCLVAGPVAAGDPPRLGRLFLTPAQRDAIDARQQPATPPTALAPASMQTSPGTDQPATAVSRVDGVVRRSGGPAVVWIDEVPHQVQLGSSLKDVPGARLEGDTVVLRDPSGRTKRLRAGQSVDPQ